MRQDYVCEWEVVRARLRVEGWKLRRVWLERNRVRRSPDGGAPPPGWRPEVGGVQHRATPSLSGSLLSAASPPAVRLVLSYRAGLELFLPTSSLSVPLPATQERCRR